MNTGSSSTASSYFAQCRICPSSSVPVAAIIQESHESSRRGTFTDVACVLVANDGQCRAIRKMRIEGTLRSIISYDLVVACYIRSLKKGRAAKGRAALYISNYNFISGVRSIFSNHALNPLRKSLRETSYYFLFFQRFTYRLSKFVSKMTH